MVNWRTKKRLQSYGYTNLLFSYYVLVPLWITLVIFLIGPNITSVEAVEEFLSLSTNVTQSLIAVTLTGLAILVSFSDRDFLLYFSSEGNFSALLFIFEYTVLLTIVSTLIGLILQSVLYNQFLAYIYIFIFLHTIGTILALIDTIIRFAETKSDYDAVKNIDDVPEKLKQDMKRMIEEGSDRD